MSNVWSDVKKLRDLTRPILRSELIGLEREPVYDLLVAECHEALSFLFDEDGLVVELRAFGAVWYGDVRRVYSGYFNDLEKLARCAVALSMDRRPEGVFVTMQRLKPELLGRRFNDCQPSKQATADCDVVGYRHLIFDLDTRKISGISSTPDQHEYAIERAQQIAERLVGAGFPRPFRTDSGNGSHLIYRVDLGVEDKVLLQAVLAEASERFDDDRTQVDRGLFNESRVLKLPGTIVRKGSEVQELGLLHRVARVLETPETFEAVPRELLESFASPQAKTVSVVACGSGSGQGSVRRSRSRLRGRSSGRWGDWNGMEAWARDYPINLGPEMALVDTGVTVGRKWRIHPCPCPRQCKDGAALLEWNDGRCGFRCCHANCPIAPDDIPNEEKWRRFREFFEPEARERREAREAREMGKRRSSSSGRSSKGERAQVEDDPSAGAEDENDAEGDQAEASEKTPKRRRGRPRKPPLPPEEGSEEALELYGLIKLLTDPDEGDEEVIEQLDDDVKDALVRAWSKLTALERSDTERYLKAVFKYVRRLSQPLAKEWLLDAKRSLLPRSAQVVQKVWDYRELTVPLVLPDNHLAHPDGSLQSFHADSFNQERICPVPLLVSGRVLKDDGRERLRLSWLRGVWQHHVVDRAIVFDGRKIQTLADVGLTVSSVNGHALTRYLSEFEQTNFGALPVAHSSSHFGWDRCGVELASSFLMGTKLITAQGEEEQCVDDPSSWSETTRLFDGESEGQVQLAQAFASRGTLEGWREAMGLVHHIPKVIIAMYASLAAPLVSILDHVRTPILDWAGYTSAGKTTTQRVGASVWGKPDETSTSSPMRGWNMSATNIERFAAGMCHLPVILNDTKKADERLDFSRMIYMLSEGQGKGRGTVKGMQAQSHWKTVVLSSGENRLTDFATESDGGARARVLQFHGSPFPDDSRVLVSDLRDQMDCHYGHAGPIWLQWILNHLDERTEWIHRCSETTALLRSRHPTAVAERLAADLAVIDLAAQLAHDALKLPWAYQDTIEHVFPDIMAMTADADVAARALRDVFDWCMAHEDEFEGRRTSHNTAPTAGWIGKWQPESHGRPWKTLDLIPERLDRFLDSRRYRPRSIRQSWAERDWLVTPNGEKNRHHTMLRSLSGGRMRLVVLRRQAIEEICLGDAEEEPLDDASTSLDHELNGHRHDPLDPYFDPEIDPKTRH